MIVLATAFRDLSDSAIRLTSSSGSLIENAVESAGVISTSSMSLEISAKARFQSSAKGPDVVSFGRVPTFFCHQRLSKLLTSIEYAHSRMTYSGTFNNLQAFIKCLRLGLRVLCRHQKFHRDLPTLQRLKKLRYSTPIIALVGSRARYRKAEFAHLSWRW